MTRAAGDDGEAAANGQPLAVGLAASAVEYLTDAAQRNVMFLDVLRRRGNQFQEHVEGRAEPVLSYDYEILAKGTDLPRPVNYGLVAIMPPPGVVVDPASGRSSSSTRAPAMGPGSAASRPTARSASPCAPGTPAISSASCRTPCRARRSRT